MTIFDVIKYPISEAPTIEELNNVPESIFELWYVWVCKNNSHKDYSTKKATDLLRYMILVHDEDVVEEKPDIHDVNNVQKWHVYDALMFQLYANEPDEM